MDSFKEKEVLQFKMILKPTFADISESATSGATSFSGNTNIQDSISKTKWIRYEGYQCCCHPDFSY